MMLKFSWNGQVQAWARTRVGISRGGALRFVNLAPLRDFEHQVATAAAIAARSQGWRLVDDEPVTLVLHFRLQVPASWSKKRQREMTGRPHTSRPDLDNCGKSVLDSLKLAGVFRDDAQVSTLVASKAWSETPGVDVEIQETHQ